ncbi:MAG: BREX system P-loop protein BrxC [Deltaproteobacteria bacterium]|nr:BREX system P-loop protein BrxC [Deltaproteobacteria bacterium]
MLIRELFSANVARDIPPVVYFHEQSPAKLKAEVDEYIITGGFPDGDPRARRLKSGIHEQLVHLLTAVLSELMKKTGPELPASWISGFYGSGKSSFAKLIGLALDGAKLPDGKTVAEALLARDDSPKKQEVVAAWKALLAKVDPIAVVFDIGGVARDDEHIHAAALRQIQVRLGYCSKSHLVAEHELKLERDGDWDRFLLMAEKTLGKPWKVAKDEQQADDHFSHVMHKLESERYRDPMSWLDARAGSRTGAGSSVREVVEAIDAMLSIRAPGKALFIVVDEVSQYVHQDENRMLKLQSFVSELGQKLKGAVWLFATGQQKLEDSGQADNIGKLKDRFPPNLRVHLHPSNIRDVVHKRLLAKKKELEPQLRELFQKHRADLKLYGYACEEITEEDFLEVYPMLPGHVDLLMQITSSLRTRSTRVQGDDHAIRGLLQLLGELFREQKLGEREVGELVTIDAIFEVQHSALEADVQTTLARIFDHSDIRDDAVAQRVARAVALLELIQEQEPTTPELIAKCLYRKLGEGNQVQAVTQALEKLSSLNLIAYSAKHGYKVQSSAGQEWERERDDIGITSEQVAEVVQGKIKELLATPDRPRYKGRPFPWAAFLSDGKHLHDERVQDPRDDSAVTVDFRFLRAKDERTASAWIQRSDQKPLNDRLIWVVGDPGAIESITRDYAKSTHMVKRYSARRESLPKEKARLLLEEEGRLEGWEKKVVSAVAGAFLEGSMYFRGRPLEPRVLGSAFATALHAAAERILPDLYPYFSDIAVTDSELSQLLEKQLSGPSNKFLEAGLGILSLDAGRYVATCSGAEPSRVLNHIETTKGASGATVIATFGGPPYGYPVDVVRACLAGLLRAGKIRIRPEQGPEITSINDPGTRDMFRRDRDLRRADIFPAKEGTITPRDKVAIRSFFKKHLDLDLDAENDAFADAVYQQFPGRRERLRELEALYDRLPGRPPLPQALTRLGKALEDCRRSRQVEETVVAVKKNLDALADGLQQLGMLESELSEEAIKAVNRIAAVCETELAQLSEVNGLAELDGDVKALIDQLKGERPWRGIGAVEAAAVRIRARYLETRKALLNRQNAEAEASRARVKARSGWEKLSGDQAHSVLRPIAEALFDTSPDAVAPRLGEMRARFPQRLVAGEEVANDRLDELLAGIMDAQVVKVEAGIRGREVSSRKELKTLLNELEDRIGPLLDKGARIRIT